MLKQCACCGTEKDVSEFHKNRRNADGLHSYCKACNALKAKKFNKTENGKHNVMVAQKNNLKVAISNMEKAQYQTWPRVLNSAEKHLA